jgi:protein polybromo-1
MADVSLEGSFDITAEVIESTPIEKCSLNPRRGRNSRRLLTGFIIYASEVRKEVVEQYPDQNFGFISKLVGDKWRALSTDVRYKYHQRALIHNKRIK